MNNLLLIPLCFLAGVGAPAFSPIHTMNESQQIKTTSAAHTPEPWTFKEHNWSDTSIYKNGDHMFTLSIENEATEDNQEQLEEQQSRDARFITQALNACAGMADPAAEIAALREQRDALLEAAKALQDEYDDQKSQFGTEYIWKKYEDVEAVERARAAIAKADQQA